MIQCYNTPIFRALTDDVDVGSGYELHFFETNTSTYKEVYADAEATTLLPNPVIANANGRFPQIFCKPNNSVYKVALTVPGGSLSSPIWSADPVDLSAILDINALDFRPLQYWGQTTGTANAYKVDPVPGIPTPYDGMLGMIQIHTNNTENPTLQVLLAEGGAAYSTAAYFKKYNADGGKIDLIDEDMMAGQRYIITFDGVDWVVLNPEHLYKKSFNSNKIDNLSKTGKYLAYVKSNSSSPTTHIDFGTNVVSAKNTNSLVNIATGQTKNISSVWAAGDGNGGYFGALPLPSNGTLYLFAIWKNDGTYDFGAGITLDPTGETNYPAIYINYRRIGACTTDGSGNIISFYQINDKTAIKPTRFYNGNTSTAGTLLPTGCPTGINMDVNCGFAQNFTADFSVHTLLSSPLVLNLVPSSNLYTMFSRRISAVPLEYPAEVCKKIITDISGNIRERSDSVVSSFSGFLYGWIDFLID